MSTLPRSLRRELVACVAGLSLVAAVLRLWGLGRSGLSHFDEGVYALSGLWALSPRGLSALDAGLIPYAPPGFPVLVGCSYALFGVSDIAALVVAAVCGIVTVPLTAWVGRRTFGLGAGVGAAGIAALSGAHTAFSRKALTDVPFLLAWVVALGLGGRFLERPNPGRALVLGLAVGLAQLFKYNGWLAGGIVLGTVVVGPLLRREERRPDRWAPLLGWGLLAALISALVYTPWFVFIERHGGYAALLRHQAGYMGGLASWGTHWAQQLDQRAALAGPGEACAFFLAVLVSGRITAMTSKAESRPIFRPVWGVLGVVGAVVLGCLPTLSWWAGLGALPWLVRSERPSVRLLGTWWLVLSILTPFYHPYARLWLPLEAAGWILLAGIAAEFGRFVSGASGKSFVGWVSAAQPTNFGRGTLRCADPPYRMAADLPVAPRSERATEWSRSHRVLTAIALTCIGLAAAQLLWSRPRYGMGWERCQGPAQSLRDIARDGLARGPLADRLRGHPVHVLGRRPLAFYLALAGSVRFRLEPGSTALLGPAEPGSWLVLDLAVLDDQERRTMADLDRFWHLEKVFRSDLDPVTLLDVHPEAARLRVEPTTEVRVYTSRPHPLPLEPG